MRGLSSSASTPRLGAKASSTFAGAASRHWPLNNRAWCTPPKSATARSRMLNLNTTRSTAGPASAPVLRRTGADAGPAVDRVVFKFNILDLAVADFGGVHQARLFRGQCLDAAPAKVLLAFAPSLGVEALEESPRIAGVQQLERLS